MENRENKRLHDSSSFIFLNIGTEKFGIIKKHEIELTSPGKRQPSAGRLQRHRMSPCSPEKRPARRGQWGEHAHPRPC